MNGPKDNPRGEGMDEPVSTKANKSVNARPVGAGRLSEAGNALLYSLLEALSLFPAAVLLAVLALDLPPLLL
ncbi:hypothetical protein [Paenibacillus pinistramenti]|uniref:hypothetical protein n=1 Tax=Paenibacillus pinistramenti TaxID=1768003 RepID=UPI00110A061D|nr:hypothetical protein [Paenibacillus pinistramenti]